MIATILRSAFGKRWSVNYETSVTGTSLILKFVSNFLKSRGFLRAAQIPANTGGNTVVG
jgi:hypothetical protein